MAVRQFKIVGTTHAHESANERTAAERVFDHWVWMLGKNPRRTALGPVRRKAIERALGLYDEETLMLAVEGCAASKWHAGENDREREFTDLELILRDEAHVERFAADGERLREQAERRRRAQASAPQVVSIASAQDPAAIQAAREALRALAAQFAGRRVAHG
jgi:hypothetical protein